MNMGYGEDLDQELEQEHKYVKAWAKPFHGWTKSHEPKYHESSSVLGGIKEEYIDRGSHFVDEETKTLNRRGMTVLSDL